MARRPNWVNCSNWASTLVHEKNSAARELIACVESGTFVQQILVILYRITMERPLVEPEHTIRYHQRHHFSPHIDSNAGIVRRTWRPTSTVSIQYTFESFDINRWNWFPSENALFRYPVSRVSVGCYSIPIFINNFNYFRCEEMAITTIWRRLPRCEFILFVWFMRLEHVLHSLIQRI